MKTVERIDVIMELYSRAGHLRSEDFLLGYTATKLAYKTIELLWDNKYWKIVLQCKNKEITADVLKELFRLHKLSPTFFFPKLNKSILVETVS